MAIIFCELAKRPGSPELPGRDVTNTVRVEPNIGPKTKEGQ